VNRRYVSPFPLTVETGQACKEFVRLCLPAKRKTHLRQPLIPSESHNRRSLCPPGLAILLASAGEDSLSAKLLCRASAWTRLRFLPHASPAIY